MQDNKVIKTTFLISVVGHLLFLSINLNPSNIIKQKDTVIRIELEKFPPPPKIPIIENKKKIDKVPEYPKEEKIQEQEEQKIEEQEEKIQEQIEEQKIEEYQTAVPPQYQDDKVEEQKTEETTVAQNIMLCYLEMIKQRIEKAKRYPLAAKRLGIEGKVYLSFTVLSNGSTQDVQITSSCGSKILDNEAASTIKRANPFPQIPKEINLSSIKITVPIVFKLQNFKEE